MHRYSTNRRSRLRLSPALAVVAALASLASAAETTKKEPVQEIHQGGYVEKVQPGVDYKDRLPRIPPREPAESLSGFHLIDGFRIEQVAAEPLVADCVDLAFDADGRLFVAEMIPYAEGGTSQFGSPNGRVSRLEDTDGDGRFDKKTVYVDRLVWPTGVACFDGGVFIAAAPELLYFKDTDGDGRADLREVVLEGFSTSNPNALPGSLRWGLDSRLHGMTSTSGGELHAVLWEKESGEKHTPIQARGRDFSIDPRTGELRLESGGAQFGMTVDEWGRKFECSNSNPCDMVMVDDRYLARNPLLAAPSPRVNIWKSGSAIFRTSPIEPWRAVRTEMRIGGVFSGPVEGGGTPAGYFTGACGLMIYKGDAWPEAFRGNAFICEGSGNLVVRMAYEPERVELAAHRTEEGRDFLTSDEVWFRPIQFTNGPDGNLYLADMYREVYEHPDAVPPSAKKYIDITAGKDRGRIYRIVAEGFRQPGPVKLEGAPTATLVGLLAHPNFWHRNTAARLLYERQDHAAVGPLVKLAAESPSPLGRMHAMYALAGQGALAPEVVLGRLADPHPRVREHAVRLAETVLADSPAVREKLYAMTGDGDLRVRYQLAFTLGEISSEKAAAALAAIARQDAADRWVRLAVMSSSLGRAGDLVADLAADPAWRSTGEARTLLAELAAQAGHEDRSDQVAEILAVLESLPEQEKPLAQAVAGGLRKGLSASHSPLLAKLTEGGGSRTGAILAGMVEEAKSLAADDDAPEDRRVGAVRSLALASFDEAADVLVDLLDSRQPQAVQKAALRALSRFREPDVARAIVDAWSGFSPQVRSEAAEALFARPERLGTLLQALEDGFILPSQLDPARIQFLLAHPDESIRRRAEELLASAKLARREDVVAAYREVLTWKGDRTRGKEVFKRECSKCHLLEGVGYDLGLPLGSVQNRGRETILLSVLDPNRDVNPAYMNYAVVTDDGLTVTGMIKAETATSITLKRAEGESDTVLRGNIDELVNTGLSIMPEGLEKQLTKQEMADVIEYLMTVQ